MYLTLVFQVFRGMKKFDLGCGFGGGKNSRDVFKVGIVFIYLFHFKFL